MRALLSLAPGGPETLAIGELPDPVPGNNEVVIGVAACGINYPDALIIEDRYQFKPPRPFAPGAEVAGTVLSAGKDVSWPPPGTRVMAMCGSGGLAEKVSVPASTCMAMPDAMPFDEGAAFIMTYGTSYHALVQRGKLAAGETLLVLGAAGGVGLAAVQIGRALGATVVAAASSEEKVAAAVAHGANRGFVYPTGEPEQRALAQLIKQECGPKGADVVFDPVGGALSEAAVRATAWNGRFLVVGFPAGIAKLPLNLLLLKGASAVGVFYGAFIDKEPETNAINNRALMALYEVGAIQPLVSGHFPFNQAGLAITELSRRQVMGKLVVEVTPQT